MPSLQLESQHTYGVEKAHKVQMLLRVGKTEPTKYSPRREADGIVLA